MSIRRPHVRETLRCLERLSKTTVLIAPFSIERLPDPIRQTLVEDARALRTYGVDVVFVEYPSSSVWANWPVATTHLTDDSDGALLQALRQHGASRLCFASRADKLMTLRGHHLDAVTLDEARVLIEGSEIDSYTRNGLRKALDACTQSSVSRVHFFNAWAAEALLDELLTDRGAGTMVYTGTL